MVSLFKDRSAASIIWLILLSFAVHSSFVVFPPSVIGNQNDGLLAIALESYFTRANPVLLVVLYHLIVLGSALGLNAIFSINKMYSRPNFLPGMSYILLTGCFQEWNNISDALIINLFIIWLFAKLLDLYNHPNARTLIFNIGLVVGVITLLYHPACVLIVAALLSIVIIRPFHINEWVILFIGALFPFYFLFSYLYLFDKLFSYKYFLPAVGLNLPDVKTTKVFVLITAVVGLILIVGFLFWQRENRKLVIQIRKRWSLMIVLLLVMLPIPFVNKDAGIETLLLWIVPVTGFVAKGFLVPKKNTLPYIMFWSLFLLTLAIGWRMI